MAKWLVSSVRVMSLGIALVALVVVAGGGRAQARGQAEAAVQAPNPASWVPARLPDGQPDMQGLYVPNYRTNVPIEIWTDAERAEYRELLKKMRGDPLGRGRGQGPGFGEGDRQGGAPPEGTVLLVDPTPDGKIPYQPWAAAKRRYMRDHLYDREEFVSTRTRCFPAGLRSMNMGSNYNGWQIAQAPGVVLILEEWHHTYRTIRLDDRPHVGSDIQLWMGDSRGHWEGNTLVVDVSNFTDKTWVVGEIDGEGPSNNAFHSPALHAVERFTLVDADRIDYEVTIDDPNVFSRPWTLHRKIWKRAASDYSLFEYACHEGNVGWATMKRGLGFTEPSSTR
jgi:hypothetical protein